MQQFLFDGVATTIPRTQGIKYAGSKLKLLSKIQKLVDSTGATSILDGFSGSTRVSQMFAQQDYIITSNDVAVWSKILASCFLQNTKEPKSYRTLIDHLNSVPSIDGWFSEHYGGLPNEGSSIQTDGLKKPWQLHNTRKLDGIREEIDQLGLGDIEKSVAITSLIFALDEVDSTLGHFSSYLSDWSPRSYKPLVLKIPNLWINKRKHTILHGDIFDAIKQGPFDLAYFDPPYGSNNEKMPPSRVRYSAYYHIWTTVCLNDKPDLFGKAKRRADSSDTDSASIFEEFRRGQNGHFLAVDAIDKLIQNVDAKYVLLSYSSGGRATAEELSEVLEQNGQIIKTIEIDYKKNVMADMRWTNEWIKDSEKPNREFLFLLEKTKPSRTLN